MPASLITLLSGSGHALVHRGQRLPCFVSCVFLSLGNKPPTPPRAGVSGAELPGTDKQGYQVTRRASARPQGLPREKKKLKWLLALRGDGRRDSADSWIRYISSLVPIATYLYYRRSGLGALSRWISCPSFLSVCATSLPVADGPAAPAAPPPLHMDAPFSARCTPSMPMSLTVEAPPWHNPRP